MHTPSLETADAFSLVIVFALVALGFVSISLLMGRFLRRPHKPYAAQAAPYESGEEPISPAYSAVSVRFYALAIVFVLFEAELLFLFPWSVVFANPTYAGSEAFGWSGFWRMMVFVALLLLGLAYAWRMGHLNWQRPQPAAINDESALPAQLYASKTGKTSKQ